MTTAAESTNVDRSSVPLLEMRGVDGAPDIIPALKGRTQIEATASQSPREIGKRAVDLGNDILNGKIPEQPTSLIAPQLITRDNVGQYHGW